jgi:hypothetical protein
VPRGPQRTGTKGRENVEIRWRYEVRNERKECDEGGIKQLQKVAGRWTGRRYKKYSKNKDEQRKGNSAVTSLYSPTETPNTLQIHKGYSYLCNRP